MNRRRTKKALAKILYHNPQGGMLSTLVRYRHRRKPLPQPTWRELLAIGSVAEQLRQIHQQAFREACIEVTGEDPETDWVYGRAV
ncbi:hypothetical protein KKB10_06455 [Patescibacteria group bacterium]|nr:hypothetical protein [Patescibacteria group bacterium]MBU1075459.1 hypothetical protein [Patescibacteria group bacterium]MBU1952199.1 hypothetical protein [Patescibacteria group bacterium]MBU2229025.1 hypothetical protein [Patescibacteria group bacterium]